MKPIDLFNAAIERPKHLLRLYDLLHDSRSRGVRSDWASSFKSLMHWPAGEAIVRVDGKDQKSVLVMRQAVGIDREQFSHDYLTELLRAVVVASISSLDRYLHDLVVHHSWMLLSKADDDVPTELKKLSISVSVTKKAIQQLRKDPKARPGHIVKKAIQERLHREYTFQKPDDVLIASRMLGLRDFWKSVAGEMPGSPAKEDVIATLRAIAKRRNEIVHEADLVLKTKAKGITLRDVSRAEAEAWVNWMNDFVSAIDKVTEASL
jgi:hypothetical protein